MKCLVILYVDVVYIFNTLVCCELTCWILSAPLVGSRCGEKGGNLRGETSEAR